MPIGEIQLLRDMYDNVTIHILSKNLTFSLEEYKEVIFSGKYINLTPLLKEFIINHLDIYGFL